MTRTYSEPMLHRQLWFLPNKLTPIEKSLIFVQPKLPNLRERTENFDKKACSEGDYECLYQGCCQSSLSGQCSFPRSYVCLPGSALPYSCSNIRTKFGFYRTGISIIACS
ncbi:hypothetical protein F3Y22_tig00116965pilonHSYRG00715 [Hibiscus syriacus]|uniref:Uncharacterized protein n=1 Tax=Hibiscus syriacus TaxID=106335 RepID=A0A6A2XXE9_HIBSY|nr:hypothetical protein F3Y22_tig00116965pilonHSYRG00715 [Hibiscus syriacus]